MELWDVYDRDRKKSGKTMERGSEFEDGEYHLVVHVCLFNSKNEMLIQQRQPFKEGWPNMWDVTVGGSAIAGDTSQTAAERELFEEIGLQMDLSYQRPHLSINFENGFDDCYLIESDIDIKDLVLQFEEVQSAKWASKDEIIELLDRREFIPYYASFIELLFDMRFRYGCIAR